MICYIDANGKIVGGTYGNSPDDLKGITSLPPDAVGVVYVDDVQYPNVEAGQSDYTIQNGIPIYTPIADSIKLQSAKDAKITELFANRESAIYAVFTSATMGHNYYYEEADVRKLQGQASLLALDPSIATIDWLTVNAGMVTHTRDQFIAVLKEGGQHERNQHNKFYNLKARVESATTVADVQSIVW